MQVAGKLIWPDRSLIYLCRSFDMLNHGQDYLEIQPVIHIGFLDYTLFSDCPEFYATNKLMNVKNHRVYSDKLTLNVVNLSKIELATDEDKEYHIDYWAKLFKATTWEEIKMLAAKDQYIDEASKTIFRLSADEQIRKRCMDREEYYLDKMAMERTIEEYHLDKMAMERTIEEYRLDKMAMERTIEEYHLNKMAMERTIEAHNAEIADKNAKLTAQEAELQRLRSEIAELKKSGLQTN